jgi:hypothetical protein
MFSIDRFLQPPVVRDAERIVRNEAVNIRHEAQVRRLGYEMLYNCYGQMVAVPIESLAEDEQ